MNLVASSTKQGSILQQLGISLWIHKKRFSVLECFAPIVNASCLVILDQPRMAAHSKAQDILQGMLKVLELSPEKIALAYLNHIQHQTESENISEVNLQQLINEITLLNPKSLLLLGNFSTILQSDRIQKLKNLNNLGIYTSHHPCMLLENPSLKKEAYRTLLALKEDVKRI